MEDTNTIYTQIQVNQKIEVLGQDNYMETQMKASGFSCDWISFINKNSLMTDCSMSMFYFTEVGICSSKIETTILGTISQELVIKEHGRLIEKFDIQEISFQPTILFRELPKML